ncbi:MAG: hypothetical protein OSJ70_03015 [Bacilli bacterium]|nr:hypothetical protein [Bacilli bacterium]
MKNIYIVGIPRSGKSTLSKIIKSKYPEMNILSFEAIRNGFIKSQPNLNMEDRNSNARQQILPSFIVEFAYWNSIITGYGNIVEGSFSDIGTLMELINDEDIIVCLGLGKRNIQEVVNGIIMHDNEKDYTKLWTKEQIKKHFYDITEKDCENYELCKKYSIEYFDTFNNREDVFLNILKYIENK